MPFTTYQYALARAQGELNLTSAAYTSVVEQVMGWDLPLLILGGGGYHNADSARCYTAIAATVAGVPLPKDVPEHDYLHHYGPGFELATSRSNREDLNTAEDLRRMRETLLRNLEELASTEACSSGVGGSGSR